MLKKLLKIIVKIIVSIVVLYGYNIITSLQNFKKQCVREIENLTAMNVDSVQILAKGIYKPEEGEK